MSNKVNVNELQSQYVQSWIQHCQELSRLDEGSAMGECTDVLLKATLRPCDLDSRDCGDASLQAQSPSHASLHWYISQLHLLINKLGGMKVKDADHFYGSDQPPGHILNTVRNLGLKRTELPQELANAQSDSNRLQFMADPDAIAPGFNLFEWMNKPLTHWHTQFTPLSPEITRPIILLPILALVGGGIWWLRK